MPLDWDSWSLADWFAWAGVGLAIAALFALWDFTQHDRSEKPAIWLGVGALVCFVVSIALRLM